MIMAVGPTVSKIVQDRGRCDRCVLILTLYVTLHFCKLNMIH